MTRQRLRESSVKWNMTLSLDSFALKIIKKSEELAFSNKAKIININVPLKVKTYIEKNLMKENNNKLNISFLLKKKVGNSVVRNKIKRRLRSAIQKKLENEKFIDINYSYIIFGKSKTITEKYSIISDELDKTFFKINQINN